MYVLLKFPIGILLNDKYSVFNALNLSKPPISVILLKLKSSVYKEVN
jgi:hypothetical protein